jgi:hypothetical protein
MDTTRAVEEEKANWTEGVPALELPPYPKADENGAPIRNFLGLLGNYEDRRKKLEALEEAADEALAPAVSMTQEGNALFEELADLFRLTPRKG